MFQYDYRNVINECLAEKGRHVLKQWQLLFSGIDIAMGSMSYCKNASE